MLDLMLWRRFGRRGLGLVEATLRANPGLAAMGPVIPLNTTFTIPDLPPPETRFVERPVSLYD